MNSNIPVLPVEEGIEQLSAAPAPTEASVEEAPRLDATHAKATLTIEDIEFPIHLPYKEFKSGSKGFCTAYKADMGDGRRYQVNINIFRIGSKHE